MQYICIVRNSFIYDFVGRFYSIDKVHLSGVRHLKMYGIFLLIFLFALNTYAATAYALPKVLFLTTGDGEGNGTVSDGVVMALQSFNKLGVQTRLENREILLKPDALASYTILIVPTRIGYHDQPYSTSLAYMSKEEMNNISDWVEKGGTLIAGNNIGRHALNLEDRLSSADRLSPTNWDLSVCLGLELIEKDISTFHLNDISLGQWDDKISKTALSRWFLVPDKINPSVAIYSWWHNGIDSIPGITNNKFGKGNALFLPTFDLLHPKADNGLSSQKELDVFYEFVYNLSIGERTNQIHLHPWKNGNTSAFCWTFDDGGTFAEYQRVVNFIDKNQSKTVFFVTPAIDSAVIPLLINQSEINLEGHSFSHPDFRSLSYFETKNEFLKNRQFWNTSFKGFRFPYVSNSFWGMYQLGELQFTYETSVAANHVDFIRGSVVPYNIPIFNADFYKTLDVLEISQIYRSDWYFYQKVLNAEAYSIEDQETDAVLFEKYLKHYLDEIVIPNKGVMVYIGHPMYSGKSAMTMRPLYRLVEHLQSKHVWVTNPNEIAERWNKLLSLEVSIQENSNFTALNLNLPNQKIEGLSFRLDKLPKKIKYKGKHKLVTIDNNIYLIIDLHNFARIKIIY